MATQHREHGHGRGGPQITADAGQVHDVAVVELDGLGGEVERQE